MKNIIEEETFLKDKTNGDIIYVIKELDDKQFYFLVLQEPNEWFNEYLEADDYEEYTPSENEIAEFNDKNKYLKRNNITL